VGIAKGYKLTIDAIVSCYVSSLLENPTRKHSSNPANSAIKPITIGISNPALGPLLSQIADGRSDMLPNTVKTNRAQQLHLSAFRKGIRAIIANVMQKPTLLAVAHVI
jgi:hypothetical protein